MQYISPVSLLKTLDTQPGARGILLARKKMLAELELNGGDSITINGRAFTKNDIINFFDELQQTGNLGWHVAIAEDHVLLRFLEDNTLEKGAWFTKNELYKDKQFIEWISPYYFNSFISLAQICLNAHDDVEWGMLLGNPLLMNFYYREEAWVMIEEMVAKDLHELQSIANTEEASKKYLNDERFIETLTGYTYITMLKALPAERFARFRDEYAWAIMRCAIYVFNKINRQRAFAMLSYASQLVVAKEVKHEIESKQLEMFKIDKRAQKVQSDKTAKRWATLIGVVFMTFMFLKGACGGDTVNDNSHSNMPIYYMDTPKTLRQVDSTGFEPAPPQQELDSSDIKKHSPAEHKK